jgi:hypothetical protein
MNREFSNKDMSKTKLLAAAKKMGLLIPIPPLEWEWTDKGFVRHPAAAVPDAAPAGERELLVESVGAMESACL